MGNVSEEAADFTLVLEEVFGPRSQAFSGDLRGLLQEMWHRGVEFGTYARNEKIEALAEVVEPRRFEEERAAKKLADMLKKKEALVEMTETLSLRLESSIDPSPIGRLAGDDLTKAVHNFLTRTARIEAGLRQLLQESEKFRLFTP